MPATVSYSRACKSVDRSLKWLDMCIERVQQQSRACLASTHDHVVSTITAAAASCGATHDHAGSAITDAAAASCDAAAVGVGVVSRANADGDQPENARADCKSTDDCSAGAQPRKSKAKKKTGVTGADSTELRSAADCIPVGI